MEIIMSSIISAAAAIIVCIVNNDKTVSLIEQRLKELEKKQDMHNNLISRTYELEKNEEILEEKIKVVNHRIDDLEDFHKG